MFLSNKLLLQFSNTQVSIQQLNGEIPIVELTFLTKYNLFCFL